MDYTKNKSAYAPQIERIVLCFFADIVCTMGMQAIIGLIYDIHVLQHIWKINGYYPKAASLKHCSNVSSMRDVDLSVLY